MAVVKVGRKEIHYQEKGEGPAVFLLSDILDGPAGFSFLVDYLSESFRVILPDYRDAPGITMLDWVQDMAVLADSLKIEKFHVIGDSMGGCVAQLFAKKHPDRLLTLILANSYLKLSAVALWAYEEVGIIFADDFRDDAFYKLMMPWIFSSRFLQFEDDLKKITAQRKKHPYYKSLKTFMRRVEILAGFHSASWLKTVRVPSLVLVAEEDITVLFRDSRDLIRHLTDPQVELFPGGHNSKIEHPTRFLEVVTAFMKSY